MKTKIGLSIPLMAVLVCCAGFFGGWTVLLLVAGYVLLKEEDSWLRKLTVKVLLVVVLSGLINAALGFIPNALGLIPQLMAIFDEYLEFNAVSELFYLLRTIVSLAADIVLFIMGVNAWKQKDMAIKSLDEQIEKHLQ